MTNFKLNTIFAVLALIGTSGALASDMPELARKMNCTACHDIDKTIVGPSWMNIAKKYKGVTRFTFDDKDYPLVEGLMMKVSKGGSGNWITTPYPMPANDAAGTKQAEIKELVIFILSLKK
jgi:cytochrome c551/c552